MSETVGPFGADDPPGTAAGAVGAAAGLRLAGQPGHGLHDRVAVGVVRPDRQAADIDLLHGVGQAVHGHVQPRAEQVLVEGGGQARRDLGGVRVIAAGVGRGEQHAGRLDLQLDGAVQVEVPVEAVVVVADRGEVTHHEPALAARLGRVVEDVGVLPEDAEVLLMHAYRVRYGLRVPALVGHGGVQVGDLAQAVAAELERVGPLPAQVLAGVEVGLPVAEPRVAVGHDHLGDRGAVHHRAFLQADLVQGQALAGVEPDPHGPVLPLEPRSVQDKRRSLRLGDLDRAQRGAVRAADRLVVIVAGLGGNRQLELVGDLEDLLLDQVDVGGDAVHRVGPGQVVLAGLDEREHAHHPPPVVLGWPERARGDRAGPDLADVVQAAPGHGRAPARVGLDDLVHEREIAVQDRHLAVDGRVQRARGDDFGVGQRDHHVDRLAGSGVDQVCAQPTVGRLAGEHVVLGRFLQAVVGEPDRLG